MNGIYLNGETDTCGKPCSCARQGLVCNSNTLQCGCPPDGAAPCTWQDANGVTQAQCCPQGTQCTLQGCACVPDCTAGPCTPDGCGGQCQPPAGQQCCGGQAIPQTQICCGGQPLPPGFTCCGGVPIANTGPNSTTCCNGVPVPPDATCCNGQILQGAWFPCDSDPQGCCPSGSVCHDTFGCMNCDDGSCQVCNPDADGNTVCNDHCRATDCYGIRWPIQSGKLGAPENFWFNNCNANTIKGFASSESFVYGQVGVGCECTPLTTVNPVKTCTAVQQAIQDAFGNN